MSELAKVIDADPGSLRQLVLTLSAGSVEWAYAKVRLMYMEHQTRALTDFISHLSHREPTDAVALVLALAETRLAIRSDRVSPEGIAALLGCASAAERLWLAEAHNVAAMALESLDRHEDAKAHYLKSHALCLEEKCMKRAATTYHNAIAAESRVRPESRLIYEYHHAYRMALEAKDFGTAGTALSNLSREYQLMHGLSLALKYINEAIALLETTHYGTYQHINALCNRCHLYLDTGQWGAAKTDYQQIGCFDMKEAKAALRTLGKFFEAHGEAVPAPVVAGTSETFTWRQRRKSSRRSLAGRWIFSSRSWKSICFSGCRSALRTSMPWRAISTAAPEIHRTRKTASSSSCIGYAASARASSFSRPAFIESPSPTPPEPFVFPSP